MRQEVAYVQLPELHLISITPRHRNRTHIDTFLRGYCGAKLDCSICRLAPIGQKMCQDLPHNVQLGALFVRRDPLAD